MRLSMLLASLAACVSSLALSPVSRAVPLAADDASSSGATTKSDGAATGKKDEKKKEGLANRQITGRATRVAFLDYGPPVDMKGDVGNMVGVTISAKAFRDVIPLLEEDKVDVVIFRINSGGGYTLEMEKLQPLFINEFEPRFRTAAWVHHAISAAAMGPWPIDEFYMEPEGHIGGCTEFHSGGIASKGMDLLEVLEQMRQASIQGGHDPKIMRAMQIREPLSVNIDENNNVEYFQDATSGKYVINPVGQVLTLNAIDAVRIKFARGIADTVPELMKAMQINEYVIAGEKATKAIHDFMRRAHRIDKEVGELSVQYRLALQAAFNLRGEDNRDLRGVEVGKARSALAKLRQQVRVNPNFRFHLAQGFGAELTDEWFEEQERLLKRLLADR